MSRGVLRSATVVAAGFLCLAAILLAGCATTYPERLNLYNMDIIIATPAQVADHYRHVNARYAKTHPGFVPTHDQGEPIPASEQIRGFTDFTFRRDHPTVFVSSDWRNCLQHEAAHVAYPNDPAWVEQNVPCLGEQVVPKVTP